MKVGDLVMLRQEMFDDRLLGVISERPYKGTVFSTMAWVVHWSNGTISTHPQRHLEVV